MAHAVNNLLEWQAISAYPLINADYMPAVTRAQRAVIEALGQMLQGAVKLGNGLTRRQPTQFAAFILRGTGGVAHSKLGEAFGNCRQLFDQRFTQAILSVTRFGIVRSSGQQNMAHGELGRLAETLGVGVEEATAGRLLGLRHLKLLLQQGGYSNVVVTFVDGIGR